MSRVAAFAIVLSLAVAPMAAVLCGVECARHTAAAHHHAAMARHDHSKASGGAVATAAPHECGHRLSVVALAASAMKAPAASILLEHDHPALSPVVGRVARSADWLRPPGRLPARLPASSVLRI